MKIFHKKLNPSIIQYRHFKNLENERLQTEVKDELLKIDLDNVDLPEFSSTFISVLEKRVSKKYNFLCANKPNFMKKDIQNATKQRSKLGNKFLEDRTIESKHLYNKQRSKLIT